MPTRRSFTPEFKASVVAEVKAGKSAREVGRAHEISDTVVRRWVARARHPARKTLVQELRTTVVAAIRDGMSVRQAMAKWQISQTTAYKWLKADKSGKARGATKVAPAPSLEATGPLAEAVSLAVAVIRHSDENWPLDSVAESAQEIISQALRAGWRLEKP